VPQRVAIFAPRSDHCLLDLLWRPRRGELPISVAMVISNHPDTAAEVRRFGIPFFHVPSAPPDKSAAEAEHLRLLRGNVDFIQRRGADIERAVLTRAVRWHSQDRVIRDGPHTIVFA
jgi:formyltetrahydrofolate hydrolase